MVMSPAWIIKGSPAAAASDAEAEPMPAAEEAPNVLSNGEPNVAVG